MKRSFIAPGLVGALALALSVSSALAQPANVGGSQQLTLGTASSLLVLVRGGGGGHGGDGGHGFGDGGGHGFHGGHFRGGFSEFGGPFYDDYGDSGCWWSARYHQWVCD